MGSLPAAGRPIVVSGLCMMEMTFWPYDLPLEKEDAWTVVWWAIVPY